MNMSKQVTGRCDICNLPITANNLAGVKRQIGFHKRKAHGILGATATPAGKRAIARTRHWRMKGLSPKEIKERERQFLEKHPESGNNNPETGGLIRKTKPKEDKTVPAYLCECPNPSCHCRFYMVIPGSK